jgi:hypothetical protein
MCLDESVSFGVSLLQTNTPIQTCPLYISIYSVGPSKKRKQEITYTCRAAGDRSSSRSLLAIAINDGLKLKAVSYYLN